MAKEVKNARLQRILNREGIKDVVILFVDGAAKAVSDDDFTDEILSRSYENNIAYVPSFNRMTVEEWADFVREAYAEGLENYNDLQDYKNNRLF